MSNFLAIATVTAAISHLLEGIKDDVAGTKVTVKPPDVANSETPASNKLNVFLYQVTPNAAYRNENLPSRDSWGGLAKTTQVALNLHYLFTAHAADSDDFIAQQILASAMRIASEYPVLSRDLIRDAISARQSLALSDLADQVESIRLTLQPMNLEELSKLWSTFFQTNYRISVAYTATAVLIDGKLQPKPALPVQKRMLYVVPFRQPVIERVEPQVVEAKAGAKITITGRNLKPAGSSGAAAMIKVQFGDISATPKPDDASDAKVVIELPAGLAAGIRTVQVVQPMLIGSPPSDHGRIQESNIAAFILAPRIISTKPDKVKRGDELEITLEPAVEARQKVVVLFGDSTLPVPMRPEGSAPASTIKVKVPDDFPEGKFLIRIRVSGAESLLQADDDDPNSATFMKYVGPTAEVKK